jgi:hypothetical protein
MAHVGSFHRFGKAQSNLTKIISGHLTP